MCQLSAFQSLHKPYHKNCLQWKEYEEFLDFIAPSDILPSLCVYTDCILSSTTLFRISTCLNYLPTNITPRSKCLTIKISVSVKVL